MARVIERVSRGHEKPIPGLRLARAIGTLIPGSHISESNSRERGFGRMGSRLNA